MPVRVRSPRFPPVFIIILYLLCMKKSQFKKLVKESIGEILKEHRRVEMDNLNKTGRSIVEEMKNLARKNGVPNV